MFAPACFSSPVACDGVCTCDTELLSGQLGTPKLLDCSKLGLADVPCEIQASFSTILISALEGWNVFGFEDIMLLE